MRKNESHTENGKSKRIFIARKKPPEVVLLSSNGMVIAYGENMDEAIEMAKRKNLHQHDSLSIYARDSQNLKKYVFFKNVFL